MLLAIAAAAAAFLAAFDQSPPAQARPVPIGTHIDWSLAEDGSPARYRSGDVTLTLRGEPSGEWEGAVHPILRVELPGFRPAGVQGNVSSETFEHRVTVGRWNAERPYVLFQSFTGGAHCCNQVTVILPENGAMRVVELGTWDGDYVEDLPTDVDGDGTLDFVFADNRFLYRFSSYADSFPPPQVINIVNGERVDVSDRPSFRPLFEQAMAEARQLCVDSQNSAPNGVCAAYVATAARAGRFDQAWAEMLRAYDRNSDWGLESQCRVALIDGECPQGQQIRFASYPEALRHFLVEAGYIAR